MLFFFVICETLVYAIRRRESHNNDNYCQEEMKVLTEKQQKKIVNDILEQAEHTQYALFALSECGVLPPKEYGDAISKLTHNTIEIANEIYGMKGVAMCNERFGIGGR